MASNLTVEHLSHRYSSEWAICDINLHIDQTGVVGLLGSNGAGKSTTMNIICGALKQTEGSVSINQIDKRKEPKLFKQQLGFLPQTPPLHHEFTIKEYLTYAADLRLIPKGYVQKAVEAAMSKTGIAHFSNRLIKNLSGGYKQRVGIAQAIIHKPGLVVLDEPTNGLDPNQNIEVRKLIQEIAAEHIVLLSSHVLSEINLLCRDIIMIEHGKIVFSDTMESFNNYIKPDSALAVFDNPPTEAALLTIQGVTRVEYLSASKIRIYFQGSTKISEQIVSESVRNNWKLQEINLERTHLDDVFKHLSLKS